MVSQKKALRETITAVGIIALVSGIFLLSTQNAGLVYASAIVTTAIVSYAGMRGIF